MTTLTLLKAIVQRDLKIAYRQRGFYLQPVLFYIMVVCLFPLALDPSATLLAQVAPGILWVAVLLAILLSLDRLFYSDWCDGSLEQMYLSPHSFTAIVAAKIVAHWLIISLPLLVLAPILGIALHLALTTIPVLLLSLLLGSGVLNLLGALGSAIHVSLPQGGLLLPLLLLPLFIPSLVFGAGAIALANAGLDSSGALAWLGVLLILSLCFVPWVCSTILRIGLG